MQKDNASLLDCIKSFRDREMKSRLHTQARQLSNFSISSLSIHARMTDRPTECRLTFSSRQQKVVLIVIHAQSYFNLMSGKEKNFAELFICTFSSFHLSFIEGLDLPFTVNSSKETCYLLTRSFFFPVRKSDGKSDLIRNKLFPELRDDDN